ncbi:MAG: WYL domain-containing protein [Pirellulales bacterium]|nr:WYL domain-containing protein [Pirellulales bacterium]
MNLTRLQRLLKLLGLLQGGRAYNAEALAEACGVSRRTVFRDLEALRAADLLLLYDEDQRRYCLPGAHFLPPTNFTPEEALALIVLCHEMGRGEMPFLAPARSAALKLEGALPARLREQLHATIDAVRISLPPANPLRGQQPVFDQLVEAAGRRRCVRIRYVAPLDDGEISTRLSPYRVFFSRRSWYVIGRSSLHRGTRTFNVGRILSLVPLEDTYAIPRGFSVERHLRNAWHLIPEPGPDQDVVIRFQKKVARNVAEVQWHKTQRVEFNTDGTLDFRVTVSGVHEISWWVLGYGDQAEVLHPPELRRIVAAHAARMTRLYRGGNPAGPVRDD